MSGATVLQRILVIGTSGCGKSTLARSLGPRLDLPVYELDRLFWLPDWQMRPPADFREQVKCVSAHPRWIIDGNYSIVRDLLWPRADTMIWLDYGLARTFLQVLGRTLRRVLTAEELFAGNREDLRRAFLSRDSILLWVLKTHRRRRRQLTRLLAEPGRPPVLRFRNPRQTTAWLATLPGHPGDTIAGTRR